MQNPYHMLTNKILLETAIFILDRNNPRAYWTGYYSLACTGTIFFPFIDQGFEEFTQSHAQINYHVKN